MASNQSNEREGSAVNGSARSEKGNGEGDDDDATVVIAVEDFLAAQRQCSRANVEASYGTGLPVSPSLLGYDGARAAREDAFSRLRNSPAHGLGALAAKRVVLLTQVALLGSDDPNIFEYAIELVEEYHAALVAVSPREKVPDKPSLAGWIDTSLTSLPHLVGVTEPSRKSG